MAMVQVWCVGVSEGVMVKVSLCRRCAAHVSVVCSDVPLHSPVPVSGHPSLPLPSACVRSPLPPTSQCLCQVTPPSTPQCLCQVTPPSTPQCLCQVTPPSSPCRFLDCKEDNADKFFTPAQRSMIVWDILQRVPYGEKEEQYGEGRGRGMYVRMWVGGGGRWSYD